MKLSTASIALFTAFIIACSGETSSVPSRPIDPLADEMGRRGAQLYQESCAMCHGSGNATPTAPSLVFSRILQDDPRGVARTIWKGQAGVSNPSAIMPAIPDLTAEEIQALLLWMNRAFLQRDSSPSLQELEQWRADDLGNE